MNNKDLQKKLQEAEKTILLLQNELEETNQGVVALTMELEKIKEELVLLLQKELEETNQGIVTLTIDLEKTKEELVRKEKLAAVGKLAGSVGHELRNPLGVINNSIYYLNMKLTDADEKIKRHLDIIQREVQRSDRIISDLLDFARVKSLKIERVDANYLINETLKTISIPENIKIKLDLDSSLLKIPLDQLKIQQVYQNIIINAIQAMPKGGMLKITTEVNKEMIAIIFEDTGMGIPKENYDKIFEPLFSTKAKGIGLGLSIVKEIIKLHKGSLEFESEVGVGSKFIVKLPIKTKKEA